MRKITRQVAGAFVNGETKSVGNTVSTGTELILHGNVIARRTEGRIEATLAGWPTVTTRERLNGLCQLLGVDGFCQHKLEQYFQGKRILSNDWVVLEKIVITPTQQRTANSYARKCGHGSATTVIIDPKIITPEIREHIRYGYRKYTTGQYVPNAYRLNFGWKNTYYQQATTIVALPAE